MGRHPARRRLLLRPREEAARRAAGRGARRLRAGRDASPTSSRSACPIKPAPPDVTPQVTQVLDFEPDVIIYSAQGADCWNLVDGLGRLGWTPGADPAHPVAALHRPAEDEGAPRPRQGHPLRRRPGASLPSPDSITDPRIKLEARPTSRRPRKYGMQAADITKGFAGAGWNAMMTLWEQAASSSTTARSSRPRPSGRRCGHRGEPHLRLGALRVRRGAGAVHRSVQLQGEPTQWDGESMRSSNPSFSGLDLIAGTELKPGP